MTEATQKIRKTENMARYNLFLWQELVTEFLNINTDITGSALNNGNLMLTLRSVTSINI